LCFGNAVDFDITVFIGSLQAYLASYPRWTLYCVEQIYSLLCLPDIVEGKLGYIAAVAVGAVVTAVCVNVLKSLARKNGSSTDEKEDDLDLDFEIN
jgi:fructose-specific phosphotransferase system IIC component